MSVRAIADDYLRQGWSVVPIPYRTKAPVLDGWQNLRLSACQFDQYVGNLRTNIGVLLGQPSQWLIDVDLDHELAVLLAPSLLPLTGAIFGRASKRRSHWLYYAASPIATCQWRLADRKMVVELRSTGGQTVFPPSIHPCGERIEWDADGEPEVVDPLELEAQLGRLYHQVAARAQVPPKPRPAIANFDALAPRHIIDRARRYVAKLPPAISGQGGHDATFHAACSLVIGFGLDRGDALALLCQWNDSHCQPPWSARELEHKVDDALKEPGWRGYLLTGQPRPIRAPATSAIERANRHAIEHRRRTRRRAHA